jgi:hypothetical protein
VLDEPKPNFDFVDNINLLQLLVSSIILFMNVFFKKETQSYSNESSSSRDIQDTMVEISGG